ncbi:methyltransferase domain-containing protein [Aerobium aerolatum]|uniref:Methyltransferase domain-containing protein n=1 Tax=Aquamicrobium aerolatum DSM 21857 TaxID=1121003 RepID=A0A1I3RJK9_9HYPH|nr:methyltransferase domain-containing protein [Aquamicrobium aerolatum]SFJ46032.1 Methyltransferase domain-containing protein [Aquamicrobium aerolatum DSM 21857]
MEPVFDLQSLVARKRRARRIDDRGAHFLMQRAAEDVADRLSTVQRSFGTAASVLSQTDAAQRMLQQSGKVENIFRVETDAALLDGDGLVAQDEILPLQPESVDLVISLYALQEANDLPGMLIQIRRSLRPDGLFLGCLAGAGTLGELREALLAAETELYGGASPRVFPFADVRDMGGLLQRAGFALPVTDSESVTVRYDSMFALIRDLRAMGATNSLLARSRKPASKALFLRAAEIYAERFSDPDGRVRATFSTIWLSGWAPHASQQKPLEPGSAKVSLAKILSLKPEEE